jgi:nucleoside-diphosphate-sugar epimerase
MNRVFRSDVATALITGIQGFTGRYLAQELRAAGYTVVGLSHELVDKGDSEVVHQQDLLDRDGLFGVIAQVKPEVVVHLAGIAFVAHGDAEAIYRTNVVGTRNLLEAVAKSGCRASSILLASSANVYGNATAEPIEETTPTAPANDYAVSKLAMEHMASLWGDQLPITIVRPFNYTGVGQSLSFILPKIVDHFRRRAPIIELGNLDVIRDFSDVRSVVKRYQLLLMNEARGGEIYNVCSGRGYSLSDVLQIMRELSGHGPQIRVNPAFVRANEVRRLIGSQAKLDAVIGAVPEVPLRETLKWMLGNPN